jgi:predicted N-formylglutamate amidohydrolase
MFTANSVLASCQGRCSLKNRRWIVTCEHGGNQVPKVYASLFSGYADILHSHNGWDPGAFEVAKLLADHLKAPFFFTTITRLLVDCNRSPGNPEVFSEISRKLSRREREKIIASHHLPHRQKVAHAVSQNLKKGYHVIHLAVHSFTPMLSGIRRQVHIGLLYDSTRPPEQQFCRRWQQEITRRRPFLKVRRNYPYLGKSDGLATWLRRLHDAPVYIGIEVEINQRLAVDQTEQPSLASLLAQSLLVL